MRLSLVAATLAAASLLLPAPASAAFSVTGFSASSTTSVAGAHPDLTTDLTFSTTSPQPGHLFPDGNVRDLAVSLPAGLSGELAAVPRCLQSDFAQGACAARSQVGVVNVWLVSGGPLSETTLPVFNMQARNAGETAELAFSLAGGVTIHLPIALRSDGDYGLDVIDAGVQRNLAVVGVGLTVWGVPADSSHDGQRLDMRTLQPIPPPLQPRVPFFTNPTRCDAPLDLTAKASSYQEPTTMVEKSTSLPPLTNCDELEFEPTLKARPTTNAADSPSGLDVDLKLRQNEDPDGRATAQLRDAEVTLPEGLVVNPSSANGLGSCTPEQIGLKTPAGVADAHFDLAEPSCPDAANIGRVEIDTPVFEDPLKGSVYLASPHQNPFGSLLALYLVIEGHGLVIKLPGKVTADPQTGRLSASFAENPQLPFEHLRMNLFGGALAPLSTPSACGTYATTSVMTPWSAPDSGPPATPKDEYAISQGANGAACGAQANSPSFSAGSTAPLAGTYQPFVVDLRREDGTQRFSSVTVTPPPGLVAKLAGTATCSDAELAAAAAKSGTEEQTHPSCPAASQIGSVYASAGSGPAPYNAPGTAYLTGPYKGAPLSLAIVTPAVAGPFDLGTIVVRATLEIDPKTAQVKAVSDPIPTILRGIPLDIRSVSIRLDKPGFALNPSSCDPTSVDGSLLSTAGSSAALRSRFQLGECGQLRFAPRLTLELSGPTHRSAHPRLRATLIPRPGDANIAAARITLPKTELLENAHIEAICTPARYAAGACPTASIYGHAKAWSPLLDRPLEGPVYLRASSRKLPDLVASLDGQIHLDLVGHIDSAQARIRDTFTMLPDAPLSKFVLTMQGGRRGLLVNNTGLCETTPRADVGFVAQNGKTHHARPVARADCGGTSR